MIIECDPEGYLKYMDTIEDTGNDLFPDSRSRFEGSLKVFAQVGPEGVPTAICCLSVLPFMPSERVDLATYADPEVLERARRIAELIAIERGKKLGNVACIYALWEYELHAGARFLQDFARCIHYYLDGIGILVSFPKEGGMPADIEVGLSGLQAISEVCEHQIPDKDSTLH